MQTPNLTGVIAATATPIKADFSPDIARLIPHLKELLDGGCNAINLLGTTGEATSFSMRQRLEIMQAVKSSGLPMNRFMVGTGVCSIEETTQLTQAAADLGFAGALVLPPFFYPGVEPDALVDYLDLFIKRLRPQQTKIYLYHIPQNTGVPWPIDVIVELEKQHRGLLVGLKDSSGDINYARSVVKAIPGFSVFPSSEATLNSAHTEGFAGCISATANLTHADSQVAWSKPTETEGQQAVARAAQQRGILAQEALVQSIKAALALLYNDIEWARTCPPLLPRSAEQRIKLGQDLRSAGWAA